MPRRNDTQRRNQRAATITDTATARAALTEGLSDWLRADRVTAAEWLLLLAPGDVIDDPDLVSYLHLIRRELARDHGHWLNEPKIVAKVRLAPDKGDYYVNVSDGESTYPIFFAGEPLDPPGATGVPHDLMPWDCDNLEMW